MTINNYLYALPLLFLLSCGPSAEENGNGSEPDSSVDTFALQRSAQLVLKSCETGGSVLGRNEYYSEQNGLYIVLKADSSTRHPELGESHRILEVYDAEDCERLQREVLPVNESPDFPYYLAEINYNKVMQLLAIHGVSQIYLYDLQDTVLRGPFKPRFPSPRYGVDAQSGTIKQLEMWEDYLIGYAQDYGAFVFQLQDDGTAKLVDPLVEHESETQTFHQLFALESDGGGEQLILPSYDRRSNTLSINPILKAPVPLNTENLRTAQSKRFVLLQPQQRRKGAIVLDLFEHDRRTLPADISQADSDDIVDWMEMMR